MIELCLFVVSFALCVFLFFLSRSLFASPPFLRDNYRGIKVPTALGFLFSPVFLLIWVFMKLVNYFYDLRIIRPELLLLVIGMCCIGLLDDIAERKDAKGFRGHIREFLRGNITTGFIKASCGFLISMVACAWLSRNFGQWILNSAVISLMANLFNLFDVKPGRALKIFFPLLVALIFANLSSVNPFLYPASITAGVAFALLPVDLSEKGMLGDAGSNVLGSIIGLGIVTGCGLISRLVILAFILFLTIVSEKYSFSSIISRNRVLNYIDRLGTKGTKGLSGK